MRHGRVFPSGAATCVPVTRYWWATCRDAPAIYARQDGNEALLVQPAKHLAMQLRDLCSDAHSGSHSHVNKQVLRDPCGRRVHRSHTDAVWYTAGCV